MADCPKKILFYSRSPMNSVMIRPIVRRLAGDPGLRLFFSGKPSIPSETLEETLAPLRRPSLRAGRGAEERTGGSSRACRRTGGEAEGGDAQAPGRAVSHWVARWRRFDLFVSPDIAMPARRTRRRVQVFHGVSFKGKAYSAKIHRYNHVFLVGEYMRRRFIEKGLFKEDDRALHRIGMPKTDPLLDGSLDRTDALADLGLDSSRTTVIYAPTWRRESSLNVEGEAVIDALAGMGLNVLVKIHDHSRDPQTNRRDWGAWLDAREDSRVRRVRDPDIVPFLNAADLLVTDASSVANEFTLLDRPILFMDAPDLLKVYAPTADLETWGRRIGTVVRGAANLRAAAARALSDPAAQSDVRRAAAADIFYNPGQATNAAVRTIYQILEPAS